VTIATANAGSWASRNPHIKSAQEGTTQEVVNIKSSGLRTSLGRICRETTQAFEVTLKQKCLKDFFGFFTLLSDHRVIRNFNQVRKKIPFD
jgi:hypothetical protein